MKKNEADLIPLIQIPASANYSLPDNDLLSFYQDLDERVFWINEEIGSYSLGLIHHILMWNREDKDLAPEARKPIKLLIHSPGGSLDIMNAITDVITLSKTPIYGYNLSCAYSASAMILLSCHKRFGMKNSTVLFHKGSCSGLQGSYEELAQLMDDYKRQVEKLSEAVLTYTSYTKEEVDEKMKSDWYVPAEECVERGVYDAIVSSIDELI